MAYITLAGKGRSHGYTTCTTVSGATESSVADCQGFCNHGLLIPTITASELNFTVSNVSDGTYYTVYGKDSSTVLAVASGTGNIAIESDDLKPLTGYRYIKVVSLAAQGNERTFIFTLKA